jgi:hypothetical protein
MLDAVETKTEPVATVLDKDSVPFTIIMSASLVPFLNTEGPDANFKAQILVDGPGHHVTLASPQGGKPRTVQMHNAMYFGTIAQHRAALDISLQRAWNVAKDGPFFFDEDHFKAISNTPEYLATATDFAPTSVSPLRGDEHRQLMTDSFLANVVYSHVSLTVGKGTVTVRRAPPDAEEIDAMLTALREYRDRVHPNLAKAPANG